MKFAPINKILQNQRSVEIREATTKDAEELIVAAKCYLRTSNYLLSYDEDFNPTIKEEIAWVESHDNMNSLLLVATYNKAIIATLNVVAHSQRKVRHVAELGISMLIEWRGAGLGNALFECMLAWAKNKSNLEIITLEVYSDNEPAIHLYRKFGFEKTGEQVNFFKDKAGKYYNNTSMILYLK